MRVEQARELAAQRLESGGVRQTPRRVQVLGELIAEPNDATAQKLHGRLRERGDRVGLATVYRTLSVLVDEGIVDTLSHRPGEVCYRLCGDGHHHHLLCERCHRVVELDECDLGGWVEHVAGRHGFVATDHRLEVTGLCADCGSGA